MNDGLAPAPKETGREMGVQVTAEQRGLKEHQAGVPDCRRPSEQREHHARQQRLHPEQEERAGQRREGEQGYQMRADAGGVTNKARQGRRPRQIRTAAQGFLAGIFGTPARPLDSRCDGRPGFASRTTVTPGAMSK